VKRKKQEARTSRATPNPANVCRFLKKHGEDAAVKFFSITRRLVRKIASQAKAIPRQDWQWFGRAAHHCEAHNCRYHLTTTVGPWCISTIGNLRRTMEDAPEAVGSDRLFETMVFRFRTCREPRCRCDHAPDIQLMELEMLPANDARTARQNHYAACKRWSKRDLTYLESKEARS